MANMIELGSKTDRDGKTIPVSLKAAALTTHACVVGATGSG